MLRFNPKYLIVILCLELLTPNSKERIRVFDIFYHPWVASFEKEQPWKAKEEIKSGNTSTHHNSIKSKKDVLQIENETSTIVEEKEVIKKQKNVNTVNTKSFEQSEIEIPNKTKEKLVKERKSISKDSIILNENDEIFDKVLNQVKSKNKGIYNIFIVIYRQKKETRSKEKQ